MPTRNPFPGIRPFEEYEAHLFFGRDEQVTYLQGSLKKYFVAVLGGSGSGKSSLVRAGLLPKLSKDQWDIAVFKPQNIPMANLLTALRSLDWEMNSDETFHDLIGINLDLSSNGIVDSYLQSGSKKRLLLIVDQFEELFAFRDQRIDNQKDPKRSEESIKFVQLLIQAAKSQLPICVLITMRSEFLGNCADFKGLPELINEGQFLLPRLTRSQFKDAIVKPIENSGGTVSSTLISQMLNDIEDDPDQLPVLQHSLMRMWNQGVRAATNPLHITVEHYEAVGGMTNAINAHADEVLASLKKEGLEEKTKIIFQRITEKKASGVSVRSPKTLMELTSLTGKSIKDAKHVVQAFRIEGVNFLLPPEKISLEPFSSIDISHESLIRKWKKLNEWIDEEEIDKVTLFRLIDREKDYRTEDKAYLQGAVLAYYMRWGKYKRSHQPDVKKWAERYTNRFEELTSFIAESHRINEEAIRKATIKEKRQRILYASLGAVVILAIIAVLNYRLQATKTKSELLAQILSSNSLAQENLDLRKKYYVMYDSFSEVLLKRDNILSSSANEQGNEILQLNKAVVSSKRDLEGIRYKNSQLETNYKQQRAVLMNKSKNDSIRYVTAFNQMKTQNDKLKQDYAMLSNEYAGIVAGADLAYHFAPPDARKLPDVALSEFSPNEISILTSSISNFYDRLDDMRKKFAVAIEPSSAKNVEISNRVQSALREESVTVEETKQNQGDSDQSGTIIYYRPSDLHVALHVKDILLKRGLGQYEIKPSLEKSSKSGVLIKIPGSGSGGNTKSSRGSYEKK